jgi:hypothetical protein
MRVACLLGKWPRLRRTWHRIARCMQIAGLPAQSASANTLGVMPRSLRSLARQPVKEVAWEGPETSFAALRSAPEVHKPRRR